MKRISELFAWMAAVYGRKWTVNFDDSDAMRMAMAVWQDGLCDLRDGHFEVGRNACIHRRKDWPPSLPEFRRLCLGLPDAATAIAAALREDWTHPVARHFLSLISSWDRQHWSTEKLERAYRDNLETAMDMAEGDVLIPRERRLT